MVRLPCPCGKHGHGRGPEVFPVHFMDLENVSLRFKGVGREVAFLDNLNRRLRGTCLRVAVVCMMLSIAYALYPLVMWQSDQGSLIFAVVVSMKGAMALMLLMNVALLLMPQVLERIGAAAHEQALLITVLFSQVASASRRDYVAKLLGHPDPAGFGGHNEQEGTQTLMMLCSLLVVSHTALPLRFRTLLIVDGFMLLLYGLVSLGLAAGAPRVTDFASVAIFVALQAFGKRTSERNERLVFFAFLLEKSRRAQAEFKLSQSAPGNPGGEGANGGGSDTTSCAPTTATGEIFSRLQSEAESRLTLENIQAIGRQEQWLIGEEEVVVDPRAVLGGGGFGLVVAGEFHGSPVACKCSFRVGSARLLADIGNELRLMRKLRHPNIVLFHGCCFNVESSDMVLVMERLFGELLHAFVARGPDGAERCKSVEGVCQALMYLHSRRPPVVHGDLKPSNIIIEGRGPGVRTKLLDFGLARFLTSSATPGGGTYRWIAPDVFGRNGRPDPKDDVFAVGLVLFFVATGHEPFEGLGRRILRLLAHGHGGAHPALTWPPEMSEFAAHARPVADACTCRLAADRLSVEQTYAQLRAHGGQGGGPQAEALPRGPTPAGLWRAVSEARQIWQQGPGARAAAALTGQLAAMPVAAGCLAAVVEAEAEPPAAAAPLLYPGLRPTPADTIVRDLLGTAATWNHATAADDCCDAHAVLGFLLALAGDLQGRMRCGALSANPRQCPACLRLIHGDPGDGSFECPVCDYEGPPADPAGWAEDPCAEESC